MTAPCFVDANILVYASNPTDPHKQELARLLLDRLWREQSGRTSIQVLNEYYAVVTRKLHAHVPAEKAWSQVDELLQWHPHPVDAALLRRARQVEARCKLSWWDSLIVAAAQLEGCSLLYTEDLQHGSLFDGLRVVNPFLAHVQEEPAPYRVEAASRHRPRGRPRKHAA